MKWKKAKLTSIIKISIWLRKAPYVNIALIHQDISLFHLIDVATSALDSVTEKYIQDALHYLMQGKTTIVIAHRLSTLSEIDRILASVVARCKIQH